MLSAVFLLAKNEEDTALNPYFFLMLDIASVANNLWLLVRGKAIKSGQLDNF